MAWVRWSQCQEGLFLREMSLGSGSAGVRNSPSIYIHLPGLGVQDPCSPQGGADFL